MLLSYICVALATILASSGEKVILNARQAIPTPTVNFVSTSVLVIDVYPTLSTSTAYATSYVTVHRCPPTVSHCPLESITTETIQVVDTVSLCPATYVSYTVSSLVTTAGVQTSAHSLLPATPAPIATTIVYHPPGPTVSGPPLVLPSLSVGSMVPGMSAPMATLSFLSTLSSSYLESASTISSGSGQVPNSTLSMRTTSVSSRPTTSLRNDQTTPSLTSAARGTSMWTLTTSWQAPLSPSVVSSPISGSIWAAGTSGLEFTSLSPSSSSLQVPFSVQLGSSVFANSNSAPLTASSFTGYSSGRQPSNALATSQTPILTYQSPTPLTSGFSSAPSLSLANSSASWTMTPSATTQISAGSSSSSLSTPLRRPDITSSPASTDITLLSAGTSSQFSISAAVAPSLSYAVTFRTSQLITSFQPTPVPAANTLGGISLYSAPSAGRPLSSLVMQSHSSEMLLTSLTNTVASYTAVIGSSTTIFTLPHYNTAQLSDTSTRSSKAAITLSMPGPETVAPARESISGGSIVRPVTGTSATTQVTSVDLMSVTTHSIMTPSYSTTQTGHPPSPSSHRITKLVPSYTAVIGTSTTVFTLPEEASQAPSAGALNGNSAALAHSTITGATVMPAVSISSLARASGYSIVVVGSGYTSSTIVSFGPEALSPPSTVTIASSLASTVEVTALSTAFVPMILSPSPQAPHFRSSQGPSSATVVHTRSSPTFTGALSTGALQSNTLTENYHVTTSRSMIVAFGSTHLTPTPVVTSQQQVSTMSSIVATSYGAQPQVNVTATSTTPRPSVPASFQGDGITLTAAEPFVIIVLAFLTFVAVH